MKPHIWFSDGWWCCGMRGGICCALGITPLDAFNKWKAHPVL